MNLLFQGRCTTCGLLAYFFAVRYFTVHKKYCTYAHTFIYIYYISRCKARYNIYKRAKGEGVKGPSDGAKYVFKDKVEGVK